MRQFLLVVLTLLSGGLSAQDQFFVSPGGNDASAGTLVQPWKTVQHALDHAVPGCTIFLMGGSFRENAVATVSGTITNPIRLVNYNNQNAVMDGSLSSGGPLLRIANVSHFSVEGIEFANCTVNNSSGIFVEGACDAVELRNNKLHDIHFSANASDVAGAAHLAQAIVVKGNSTTAITNLVISGNEIYNCRTGWHSAIFLSGNVEGFSILKNRIHDVQHDGIGLGGHTGSCSDPDADQPRNGVLRWNTVQASLTGLVIDGATNCVAENNTLTGNVRGMIITCSMTGKTAAGITVQNNIVRANSHGGILAGGFDYPVATGIVTGLLVCNNTIISNTGGIQPAGEISVYWCEEAVFSSNLVYSSNAGPLVDVRVGQASVSFRHNLYYSTTAPEWYWGSSSATTLSSWTALCNGEQGSIFADPLFVNAGQNDFHLHPSSPAIDAGDSARVTSPLETDMDTMSRQQNGRVDVGADEYGTAVGIPVHGAGNIPYVLFDRANDVVKVVFMYPATHESRVDLMSVNGKLIASTRVPLHHSSVQFSTAGLAAGTYMIFCPESAMAVKFVK